MNEDRVSWAGGNAQSSSVHQDTKQTKNDERTQLLLQE